MSPDSSKHQSKEDRKKQFVDLSKVGLVFRSYSKIVEKEKFYVVIGVSEDSVLIGHVLINTRINRNYAPTPELQTLHMPIYATDYDFLDHDFYIDCTKNFDLKYERVEDMYSKNSGQYKGSLNPNQIKFLKHLIKNYPTIENKLKKNTAINKLNTYKNRQHNWRVS